MAAILIVCTNFTTILRLIHILNIILTEIFLFQWHEHLFAKWGEEFFTSLPSRVPKVNSPYVLITWHKYGFFLWLICVTFTWKTPVFVAFFTPSSSSSVSSLISQNPIAILLRVKWLGIVFFFSLKQINANPLKIMSLTFSNSS